MNPGAVAYQAEEEVLNSEQEEAPLPIIGEVESSEEEHLVVSGSPEVSAESVRQPKQAGFCIC